jgi:hypothetical protein
MTESDYVVVARGDAASRYHEPATESTREDPVPDCRYQGDTDPDWTDRPRDGIEVWKDPCSWCTGEADRHHGGGAPAGGDA